MKMTGDFIEKFAVLCEFLMAKENFFISSSSSAQSERAADGVRQRGLSINSISSIFVFDALIPEHHKNKSSISLKAIFKHFCLRRSLSALSVTRRGDCLMAINRSSNVLTPHD